MRGAPKTSHSKQILSLLISRIKLDLGNLSPFSFFLPQMVSVTGRKLRKLPGHHQPHEVSVKLLLGAWNPPGYPGPKEWVSWESRRHLWLLLISPYPLGSFTTVGRLGGKWKWVSLDTHFWLIFFLSSCLLQKGNLFSLQSKAQGHTGLD